MLIVRVMTGVSGSSTTSEYVRQELRAVVGARTGQQGQASSSGGRGAAAAHLISPHQVNPADLEALGLTFEMPPAGKSRAACVFFSTGGE